MIAIAAAGAFVRTVRPVGGPPQEVHDAQVSFPQLPHWLQFWIFETPAPMNSAELWSVERT